MTLRSSIKRIVAGVVVTVAILIGLASMIWGSEDEPYAWLEEDLQ